MAVILATEDKAKLRKLLEQQYNLEEMKNLAFDLGIDYNKLPHETTVGFSRELLSYCERMGFVGNLVAKMLSRQHGEECEELARLLAKLPVSSSRTKVQIIIARDILRNPSEIMEIIADLAKRLGIDPDQVELLGTAPGSLRLLVGMPEDAANVLVKSEINDLVNGRYRVISITVFDSLDTASQEAWRTAALHRLPASQGDAPSSSVSWEGTTRTAQESRSFQNRLATVFQEQYAGFEKNAVVIEYGNKKVYTSYIFDPLDDWYEFRAPLGRISEREKYGFVRALDEPIEGITVAVEEGVVVIRGRRGGLSDKPDEYILHAYIEDGSKVKKFLERVAEYSKKR